MLLVYCPQTTNRLLYTLDLLLLQMHGISFEVTNDKELYQQSDLPSLNYSDRSIKAQELYYRPASLLFRTGIQKQDIRFEFRNENPYLYFSGSSNALFDPLAASFFMVSRYEEYLPFEPDVFGRFEARSSCLFSHNSIDIPVVTVWSEEIKTMLLALYPSLQVKPRSFRSQVSIDIDQAYAYKYRGIKRNVFSFLKNVSTLQIKQVTQQLRMLSTNENDPYDTFQYLFQCQQKWEMHFIFFFNLGPYSQYDKNLSAYNPYQQQLIRRLSQQASIGLHPSFYSNENPERLFTEKKKLQEVSNTPITKSRQHYLKLYFPLTYRNLLEAGFTEDYSMGYASQPGFRAGICEPFYWFDILADKKTNLMVFPITYMEGSLGEDLHLTPEEALVYSNKLIQTVKKYNGYFLSIWHNHTVNDLFFWKGWRYVFEQSLDELKKVSP